PAVQGVRKAGGDEQQKRFVDPVHQHQPECQRYGAQSAKGYDIGQVHQARVDSPLDRRPIRHLMSPPYIGLPSMACSWFVSSPTTDPAYDKEVAMTTADNQGRFQAANASSGLDYRTAGVDIEAGEALVEA